MFGKKALVTSRGVDLLDFEDPMLVRGLEHVEPEKPVQCSLVEDMLHVDLFVWLVGNEEKMRWIENQYS